VTGARIAALMLAAVLIWRWKMDKTRLVFAKTIYGEARGEGRDGMEAVAAVIMNRVEADSWFGKTPLDVALKPWQFSAWNANDPNRGVIEALEPGQGDAIFDAAYEIAGAALDGSLADPTGGATHYHASWITPAWAASGDHIATIGTHLFYSNVA
jgi:N-acetylmuramoyl-L-alanine amidase